MKNDLTFANADLALDGELVRGALRVSGGKIAAIDPGRAVPPGAVDCGGDLLMPGIVELHTDNLERHLQPRPGVDWPHDAAILAHDGELASVGITTVFDALRVGSVISRAQFGYTRYARAVATEILQMRARGALRISHFLHLRAEVCSETLIQELDTFGPEDRVGIVSLMDHTPGQRQFRDLSKFKEYVCGKKGLSEAEFADHAANLLALRSRLGDVHEQAALAAAKNFGAVLASHDDTTVEQVAVSRGHGVRLAEFPTTAEAARACRENGIAVMMGAPNLIRGGSHSGNVAAADLVASGSLDILSSDYVPASLLLAAVKLGQVTGDLPCGIAAVTSGPARAAGLEDRGRLAQGLRADLLRVSLEGEAPVVRGVWSRGHQVG